MKTLLPSILFALTLAFSPLVSAESAPADAPQTVNINTADADELDKYLNGIGKAKAQAIVDYRNEHGAFESIEALDAVKGIGTSIIEKNRDIITL